jgi:uncharacterized protein
LFNISGVEFAQRYGPWAVVAGAAEGVGASVSRLLGARGVNVVLVDFREAAAEETAATVDAETTTVVLDLSRPDAAAGLAEAAAGFEVGLVVYNAGGDPYKSRFLDQPAGTWQEMVARNCATVAGVAHHFGGLMVQRGHGGIALVTSGAAWAGGSHLAIYGATKAFNLILAESLWAELGPLGVDVLAMVLGRTDTPGLRRLLEGRQVQGLANPDDVARDLLDHLGDGPTFPPGPPQFGSLPRRQAVEAMGRGYSLLRG